MAKDVEYQYGHIEFHLDEAMRKKGYNKNSLAQLLQIQWAQLDRYAKGKLQRADLDILARLCFKLDCKIEDIISFVPPDTEESRLA